MGAEQNTMPTKQLDSLLALYFDPSSISSIETIHAGIENTNLKVCAEGGFYVVRIYGVSHSHIGARTEEDILFELELMSQMHKNGLPVPQVVVSISGKILECFEMDGVSRFLIVTKFIQGIEPRNFTPKMAGSLGSSVAKMHNLSVNLMLPYARSWNKSVFETTAERRSVYETLKKSPADEVAEYIAILERQHIEASTKTDISTLT